MWTLGTAVTTTRYQTVSLLTLSVLHDASRLSMPRQHISVILFSLLTPIFQGVEGKNTKSLKSYTMSRMIFTYDEDTMTRPSDWFAAPYAEGAAAVPVKGSLVLPAAEFSCQIQPDHLPSLAVPVIVLVRRGECSFNKKVMNVKQL